VSAGQADFGPYQMADHLGAYHGQVDRARELGLLPEPDVGGKRWSAAAVAQIRGRWPQILAAIEAARELGATRSACRCTARELSEHAKWEHDAVQVRDHVTGEVKTALRPPQRTRSVRAALRADRDLAPHARRIAVRATAADTALAGKGPGA
jgi:hypothetical protein